MVKVLTTPHDLTVCFMECIKAGAARLGISLEDLLYNTDIIRFANTIGTNTIIQRDGSKVGLLVTAGGEAMAPTRATEGKSPLVLPDMVLGIEEEVSSSGEIVKAPDEVVAMRSAQELIDRGARCLVVAFAKAELNPNNERLMRRTIKREYPRDFLGSVPVFLSSDISRRSGEVERINASILNAYIHAKLARLLYKSEEELRQHLYQKNLFIVHNNGAVARVAKTRAINTYNSGPVAGLIGTHLIGKLHGTRNLISADMGGTSFDLGYIRQGAITITLTPEVEGFTVNVPMLAIRAIGAGGGSIASVKDGILEVGPQSAGSMPGPACFDLGGTEPTVTDADLILGILDPHYFLGGTIILNLSKARKIVEEKIAKPLGISVEEAALAITRKIDEMMGIEIKRLKEKHWPQGENPLLVVYGGAGPTHCCNFAQVAGLKKIVITPFSAVFSAFSLSHMDVGHIYYRRVQLPLDERTNFNDLVQPITEMQKEAARDMRGEGFSIAHISSELELLVRNGAAGPEVRLTAPVNCFEDKTHLKRLIQQAQELLLSEGESERKGVMLTTLSLKVQATVPHYSISEYPRTQRGLSSAEKERRKVFLDTTRGVQEIPVYDRHHLEYGHRVTGPAIIESEHTTAFISPSFSLEVDRYHNAVIEERVYP